VLREGAAMAFDGAFGERGTYGRLAT